MNHEDTQLTASAITSLHEDTQLTIARQYNSPVAKIYFEKNTYFYSLYIYLQLFEHVGSK